MIYFLFNILTNMQPYCIDSLVSTEILTHLEMHYFNVSVIREIHLESFYNISVPYHITFLDTYNENIDCIMEIRASKCI